MVCLTGAVDVGVLFMYNIPFGLKMAVIFNTHNIVLRQFRNTKCSLTTAVEIKPALFRKLYKNWRCFRARVHTQTHLKD